MYLTSHNAKFHWNQIWECCTHGHIAQACNISYNFTHSISRSLAVVPDIFMPLDIKAVEVVIFDQSLLLFFVFTVL